MIIYNVTTHVAHSISDLWVAWMREKHLPEIMEKGCFTKYQFVKLLETDESEGITYAVQLYAPDRQAYEHYLKAYAPSLREDAFSSWGDKIISFRSLMEQID